MHSRRARSVLFSRPKSNASASEELGVAPGLIDQFLGMLIIIGPVRNAHAKHVSVKLERDDCGIALVIRATFPAVTSAESDH